MQGLKVEDYCPQKKRWWLHLREENGKVNEMPWHHKLEQYPDAYIKVVGIDEDPRGRCSVPQLEKPRRSGWGRCRGQMSSIRCAAGLTTDRMPCGPRHGNHRLLDEWRPHRGCAAYGRAFECRDNGLYDRRNDDVSVG